MAETSFTVTLTFVTEVNDGPDVSQYDKFYRAWVSELGKEHGVAYGQTARDAIINLAPVLARDPVPEQIWDHALKFAPVVRDD